MEVIYKATTIENILNALNQLQVVGIKNIEILTFVVQELQKNEILEVSNDKAGETNGN